jgi:hypothetical protein
MILRHETKRLTLVASAAILSGLVGCSMFKEQATAKLNAEVTRGPAPSAPPAAKFVVEIRPENGKPKAVEKPLAEQTFVQSALEQTGALKKFKRAFVEVYRPLPNGGWHKMNLEFDRENHRVPPEYDYALLPGDRIIVTEDTSNIMDDIIERAMKPLGLSPPKKKDPLREKYQIQG